ncbi:PIN2/TERF1-interacting telomerase inhibitor 1 isoform X1 [Anopheles gambiae]|uniref:PIN2/TERF1-interacting telomerase inhibitor 1 isoform X1 n=1 Tax=Anopheles gambiae TaxID=7165 RepID=UPI002AC99177|nr:PIN2/TERF1-interacting telomerase inhibitor 1 isoform X1 [Anopheles gambiae]
MGDGDFSSVTLSSAKARQKKLCTMRLNDPVKKPYYKDTDSFGARMLSKLGWTEGKGLGRDENGITIPISNRVKLDTEGVGFVGGRDDMWTQHEAGFTELLRRLNGDESEPAEGAGDAVIDPKSQVQSLEERSKQSRARVHYTRFTRGKDLSRVNEKDLANIFGKRSLTESSRPREEEEQPASSGGESAEEDRPVLGLSTIKASMSMQDYFKEKMKQRAAAGNGVAPVEATVKTNGQGGEEEMVTEETHDGEKIKKKKSKKKAKENEQTVEPMEEAVTVEEAPATKKSKRKREQLEEYEQEVLVNGDSVEPASEPSEPVKKKKKSKKHNSEQEPTVESACEVAEEEMVQMVDETVAAEEPVKKKKKSKKQSSEPELKVEPSSEVTEEEKVVATVENTASADEPVKKKKKSKKNTSDPEPPVVESTDEVAELEPPTDTTATVEEPVKKKKKSKTPKSESSTEEGAVENPTPEPNTVEAGEEPANATETGASTSAKKKKKKKGKRAASPADGEAANNEPASSPAVNGGTTEPASNGKESVGPMDEITLQVAAANALSAEYAGKSEETTCKVKVEVLKYLDEARFAGSNFGDIIGYRLTEDVKLVKNAASKEGGDGGPSRKFTPRRR